MVLRCSSRFSEELWTRKSQEWKAEVSEIDRERARIQQPRPSATATAAKILELANKTPTIPTKGRFPTNSVGWAKRCYRTPRSIAEVSVLLTLSHSTCSSAGTKQEIGGVSGTSFATGYARLHEMTAQSMPRPAGFAPIRLLTCYV